MASDLTTDPARRLALVTGATGYVGGLLVPALLEAGWCVRVLTRRREALPSAWVARVEVIEGDAEETGTWQRALASVDTAYFLLHSMDGKGDFARRESDIANGFADAAGRAAVRQVVYLGGLHPSNGPLSPHLSSRKQVGDILLAGPVPAVVLQAAVIIGHGSASFDMLRYLAGRLPVMVAPKWLHNRIQPIAIDDVIRYLLSAPDLPGTPNRTFDIGGPEVLSYADLIRRYAAAAGLRPRRILTVPVLTPRLASHWVAVVSPMSPGLAKPLVESLVHDVVCDEHDIRGLVPAPTGPVDVDSALQRAVRETPIDTGPKRLREAGALTATAALAGSLLTDPGSSWYRSLDKPAWQPPAAAFPLAWSALYTDIAATGAAALTCLDREGARDEAAGLRRALLMNLVLNAAWSGVFFRSRRPALAAAHAAALTASSADLTRRAWQVRPGLGKRLVPYVAWTAFATGLSAEISRRNPSRRRNA